MLTQDKATGRGVYQYSASVTVSAMTDAAADSKNVSKQGFGFVTWTHHRPNKNVDDSVRVVTASALCDYWIARDGKLYIGAATLHRV